MATAPRTLQSRGPQRPAPSKEQLRKDRITATVVLLVMAVLMALMIWLASLGNGAPESFNGYWPMMP